MRGVRIRSICLIVGEGGGDWTCTRTSTFTLEYNVAWQHITKFNGFDFKNGIPPYARNHLVYISYSSHYK